MNGSETKLLCTYVIEFSLVRSVKIKLIFDFNFVKETRSEKKNKFVTVWKLEGLRLVCGRWYKILLQSESGHALQKEMITWVEDLRQKLENSVFDINVCLKSDCCVSTLWRKL